VKKSIRRFNENIRRENIFKPTIGNESLYQGRNGNSVRIEHCATPNNLIVKSTMFLHRNIYK
jgi:hypothetical protein